MPAEPLAKVYMDPDLHRRSKARCASERTTLTAKADELFGAWLKSKSPTSPTKPIKRK